MKRDLFSKSIIAWFFYDWANSAFPTIITTFIFATYFSQRVAPNKIIGTSMWGNAISLAALIVAVVSPIFGAIADHEGRRKPWLGLFTLLMIVGSAWLWFVKPEHGYIYIALTGVVIGTIGSEVSMVFYNSMLRDLVPEKYIGRMSGWAWGFGYFGGLLALIFCLFFFMNNHFPFIALNFKSYEQVRIVGPFVAVWALLFSLPLFILTPDRATTNIPVRTAIFRGIKQLIDTIRRLRDYSNIFKFLLARMLYIDGLNTVFAFGGIYAAGAYNMSLDQVILFGITMHVTAGLGAILFAWLDDWIGPKVTILISLVIMTAAGMTMVLAHSLELFWVVGLFLSFCVGPIQAASRSMMIRLSPKEIITELFGLYALSGRATAFAGPWILGLVTLHYNSQRIGMSTIIVFLIAGGLMLLFVESPKPRSA